jgi:hypothetical protein
MKSNESLGLLRDLDEVRPFKGLYRCHLLGRVSDDAEPIGRERPTRFASRPCVGWAERSRVRDVPRPSANGVEAHRT